MEELKCFLLGFGSASLREQTSEGNDPSGIGSEELPRCVTSSVLSPELTAYLHPTEVLLLEEVLPLGLVCRQLTKAADEVSVGRTQGLYATALGSGIAKIVKSYRDAVKGVRSASAFGALKTTYGLTFRLLLRALKAQATGHVEDAVESIYQVTSNKEVPFIFRCFIGESMWLSLLYTVAHYVAHGVVLHGRKDFFISMDTQDGREEHLLHSNRLPPGVPMEVGMLILSAGRVRRILLSDTEIHGEDYLEQLAMGTQDEAAATVFSAIFNPALCEGGSLAVHELEMRVEAAHALWSKALWRKVGQTAPLLDNLQALCATFLCHRGDFWHTFVERAFVAVFSTEATGRPGAGDAAVQRSVSDSFSYARSVSGLSESSLYASFRINVACSIAARADTGAHSVEDASRLVLSRVNEIGLQYVPPQGIRLVVSKKALGFYQRLFSFHLCMRFSLHALHFTRQIFSEAIVGNRTPSVDLYRAFALLHLLHFVQTTLGYYIQADVIELYWSELEKHIRTCTSVEEAKRHHDRFVWQVAEGCFITEGSSQLFGAFQALFHSSVTLYVLCTRYRLTYWAVEGTNETPIEVSAALTALETRVQQNVVAVLTGHLSVSCRAAERALWARLDFNRYFSLKGRNTGISAVAGKYGLRGATRSVGTPFSGTKPGKSVLQRSRQDEGGLFPKPQAVMQTISPTGEYEPVTGLSGRLNTLSSFAHSGGSRPVVTPPQSPSKSVRGPSAASLRRTSTSSVVRRSTPSNVRRSDGASAAKDYSV